ncbi:MAG: bifunctional proline dehydrogenase/L-glutamate gamma-semialdehyde dehydrogenase PutA, partial [Herminiimonas sp.]|nr:bifunctional proline dehydrogenase/L-glutamate gamma-semialdehyde dehydrogenase PutA [Herminiimonas sp.]
MSIPLSLVSSSSTRPFAALMAELAAPPIPLRAAITAATRRDEQACVALLQTRYDLAEGTTSTGVNEAIATRARQLVEAVRKDRTQASGVDALMHEFSLSSHEGVALMCVAEALLRIPDAATADRLIADKISKGDWRAHLGGSPSLFVNAATWGLLITGKLAATISEQGLGSALSRLIARWGEPLIRKGVALAMRMLGNQFVAGQTIAAALENSRPCIARGYQYSYDMLGEGAITEDDARRYLTSYENTMHAIGTAAAGRGIKAGPGISVKLSALHPRYSRAQRSRVMIELLPRLKGLVLLAKRYAIGINIDAEEADRLELSLDLLEALAFDPDLAGFDGIGFVVQAYQKRCPYVLDFLVDLSRRSGRKFMVRLVKGAYWDAEIKQAQVDGLTGYPVYTRKVHTDMSYLVCARMLLAHADVLYPQFATHNAHTVAAVLHWAKQQSVTDFEFQCLHGMGGPLYDEVVGPVRLGVACRIYAPVGSHQTLLPYLVRRLLENGANSSFVNRIVDPAISIDELIADPFEVARDLGGSAHPQIGLPAALFGPDRVNSAGFDFADEQALHELALACSGLGARQWQAGPLLATKPVSRSTPQDGEPVRNPADHADVVGQVVAATAEDIEAALGAAISGAAQWQATSAGSRAITLCAAADLLEAHRDELLTLMVREAGKTLPNAMREVREAVDFLRYYAAQITADDGGMALSLGVVVCISPWNFPLSIFMGQISAALAAGNVVLAKPAGQTPLIATRAVELLHAAGVPRSALQLLPGSGPDVGAPLVADSRVRAVLFTGSTGVAQSINRTLAARSAREGIDLPLVAETGGQNAMIVDSSALPEQVVQDVMASAFDSAGQRCSALRVLCLQEEIADDVITMIKGALAQACIGNPDRLGTDIGPVIDIVAKGHLLDHVARLRSVGAPVFQMPAMSTPAAAL